MCRQSANGTGLYDCAVRPQRLSKVIPPSLSCTPPPHPFPQTSAWLALPPRVNALPVATALRVMDPERRHPVLAPPPRPEADALRFSRLTSTSSPFSPPAQAYGTVDTEHPPPQWSPRSPDEPPLQLTLSTASHPADVTGVVSPTSTYGTIAGRSFLYGTPQSDGGTPRQLSTSPATLPTPTVAPPPPLPSCTGRRWTPPTETVAAGGFHPPRADPLALSPSLQQPSPRTKRRRSGGDGGEFLHRDRSDADVQLFDVAEQKWAVPETDKRRHEADRTPRGSHLVSSSSDDEQRHGPAYVKQRRAYWSTVLNDTHRLGGAAGSTDAEEEEHEGDSPHNAGVATSRLRNEMMYEQLPPPGYAASRVVNASVIPGGAIAAYGAAHCASRQMHGAGGPHRGGAQRRRADDVVAGAWEGGPHTFAVPRGPAGDQGREHDGGGSGGSGSGSGSEGPEGDSPRVHVCSDCPYRFKRAYDLTQHKAAVHAKLRPFSCKKCGKTFGHAGTRSKHYRTIHDGLKLHRCGICERTFSEKGNMRKHMMRSHPDAGMQL